MRGFFGGEKLNKERLAKLGTAALLSYGAVSNLNAITLGRCLERAFRW